MNERHDFFPPKPEPSTAGTLLYLLFGLLAWAGQFTIVYAGHTAICALGGTSTIADWTVIATTIAAALLLTGFLAWQARFARAFGAPGRAHGGQDTESIARILAVLSLIAVLWTGATVIFVASCVQGR